MNLTSFSVFLVKLLLRLVYCRVQEFSSLATATRLPSLPLKREKRLLDNLMWQIYLTCCFAKGKRKGEEWERRKLWDSSREAYHKARTKLSSCHVVSHLSLPCKVFFFVASQRKKLKTYHALMQKLSSTPPPSFLFFFFQMTLSTINKSKENSARLERDDDEQKTTQRSEGGNHGIKTSTDNFFSLRKREKKFKVISLD